MVSNTLHIDQQELLEKLRQIKQKYARDPEYQKLRGDLPKEWPI